MYIHNDHQQNSMIINDWLKSLDTGKRYVWRNKNTYKKEGWEEKWERKSLKKEMKNDVFLWRHTWHFPALRKIANDIAWDICEASLKWRTDSVQILKDKQNNS